MNPKQLRGLIMLIIAGVGAIAVFIAVASYVSDVRADVGPTSEVYVTTEEVGVHETIDLERLDTEEVPDKYISDHMVTDQEDLVGMKASSPVEAGSYLQTDMIEPT